MRPIKPNKFPSLSILTTTAGAGSVVSPTFTGRVKEITYDGGLATGADLVVTRTSDGAILGTFTDIGTARASWRPVGAIHDAVGAAVSGAGDYWLIVDDTVTFTISSGGSEDTGLFGLYWEA